MNGFLDTKALCVSRSFSILHSAVMVVEKKFVLIDSKLINPLRKGFVCTSFTSLLMLLSGGLINGIWQLPAGAESCFFGTGRGTDLSGADMAFGSKLSCLPTSEFDAFIFLTLTAKGSGAGRSGCGGMDSSVVQGGVARVVCPYKSSPSWAFLSTESKRLKLPVLPSRISDPEWTCCIEMINVSFRLTAEELTSWQL